jgi:hypothetical protein
MPRQRGLRSGIRVEGDFVEADLDTVFALLAAAEMHSSSEERAYALRAIGEAEKAIVDGEQRLPRLNDSDRERVRDRLKRMRAVSESIRLNLK